MIYPVKRRRHQSPAVRSTRKLSRRIILSAAICLGTLPFISSWAGTSPAVPTVAVGKCPLLVLAAQNKAPPPSAPNMSGDGDSCLVKAHALDISGVEVLDLRERARFLELHVPGARQATVTELVTRPGTGSRPTIVYDGGRFRSDALQLCDRLHHAGFRQVRVVDGGIAAWAQLHALPEAMALNRLSDADVAAALAEPGSRPVVLDDALHSALPSAKAAISAARTERVIVLATATTPQSAIRTRLKKGVTTLYWSGSPEHLRQLLQTQLAQDRKRLAGPAMSKACSAL